MREKKKKEDFYMQMKYLHVCMCACIDEYNFVIPIQRPLSFVKISTKIASLQTPLPNELSLIVSQTFHQSAMQGKA